MLKPPWILQRVPSVQINRAAGHSGNFFVGCAKSLSIIKRTLPSEGAFYDWCYAPSCFTASKKKIKKFLFFRNESYEGEFSEILQELKKLIPKILDVRLNGDVCDISMENLVSGMTSPCVLDIKMGKRLYGDDATPEKQQRMIKKAIGTTSEMFGMRISGGKSCIEEQQAFCIEKDECISLDFNQLKEVLKHFITPPGQATEKSLEIANHYFGECCKMSDFMQKQKLFNFYSSSILFTFDGHTLASPCPRAKMIDFAHVTIFSNCLDEGYVEGLQNLTRLWGDVIFELNN
eukprot:GHVL01025644.1.p1 GENE.GHVL01025644.1~~GHVL01025644.1.p1  ORF type:complete len:290 (-),score=41.50 GHVL01025644.1:40-909(-)